jgi:hypothetical protein
MRKRAEEERPSKKDETPAEAKKRLGFSPAMASAAALYGATDMIQSSRNIPATLDYLIDAGRQFDAVPGTPLWAVPEFSWKDLRTISRYAKEQAVDLPIVAGMVPGNAYVVQPNSFSSALKWVAQKAGLADDMPDPHIGLSSTSVPSAMHEIGHASKVLGNDLVDDVWKSVNTASRGPLGFALRAGLASSVLVPPNKESSKTRRWIYDNAPYLVAAAQAPVLLEEARATGKAIAGARRMGVGVLPVLRDLTPAFMTYLITAAAPALATVLAKKLVLALRKDKGGDAQAEAEAEAGEEKTGGAAIEPRASGSLRTSASSAWKTGGNPPKPQTTSLAPSPAAKSMPASKPPTNKKYHEDLLESLYNPGRGLRMGAG